MLELYEFFIENRNKPLGYILLAAFVFIADRLGRKLITSQVKRLFHIDDKSEFKKYVQNQQRIEEKLQLLLEKEGIIWSAPMSLTDSENTVTKHARLSLLHWIISSLVRFAEKFTKLWRCHMSNINKGILIPLLSAIALFIKEAFGYEIEAEYIDMAANIILYVLMAAGLFMNFKKKDAPKTEDKEAYYH